MRLALLGTTLAAVALSAPARVRAQSPISVTLLSSPQPDAWAFWATGINNSGQAALTIGSPAPTPGYLWSAAQGYQNIGSYGPYWVSPLGISNNGLVVGLDLNNPTNEGLVWSASTGWQVMSGFATWYNGGQAAVFPTGINSAGQVVGNSWGSAFIWDAENGPMPLDFNPSAINDLGQVAGTGAGALIWDPVHGETPIGDGQANAINGKGQVVGQVGNQAFFWDPVGGRKLIGSFGQHCDPDPEIGCNNFAVATGVNDLGQVVGYASSPSASYVGFVWDQYGGLQQLGDLPFIRPTAINNRGEVVGRYDGAGQPQAIYAVVPAPAPPPPPPPPVGGQCTSSCSVAAGSTVSSNVTVDPGATLTVSGTVKGNVTVAPGGTLDIVDGTATGNVTLAPGATLVVQGGTVKGNVQNVGTGSIALDQSSVVTGNVQLNGATNVAIAAAVQGNLQASNLTGAVSICGAHVDGNLQMSNGAASSTIAIGASSGCAGNTITGNLQVTSNHGTATVFNNVVRVNVQCSLNSAITASGNVSSKGSLQGQCKP